MAKIEAKTVATVVDPANFKINKDKPIETDQTQIVTCYGAKGTVIDDPDAAYCKLITNLKTDARKYLIKEIRSTRRLANPNGLYPEKEKSRGGMDNYVFIEVTQEVFNDYMTYLINRKEFFLNRAERTKSHG